MTPKTQFGTLGWSYPFWRGTFYPAKLPAKNFLSYYASQFNTVEVDSSFYRIPTQQTVQNWHSQTPEGFTFSLKFPQYITHIRQLRDCQPQTAAFLNNAALLKEKLGPLLLQFPPSFTSKHMADLAAYLKALPKEHHYAVEVRSKTWLNAEFFGLLRDCGVALAWTNLDLMAQTQEVTADFIYMRWEGDRQKVDGTLGKAEVDRQSDLAMWASKLETFFGKSNFFGYFSKYYSGNPVGDAKTLQQLTTPH